MRVMEPAGPGPLRMSCEHRNGGPINPFTNKPHHPSKNITGTERQKIIREHTHVELYP